MLLDLGKALSFLLTILSLYSVLIAAFFDPNTSWQQRLVSGLTRLALAAVVSLASGLLFAFPARTNQDRRVSLLNTLPIRIFFLAAATLALLFLLTWYLRCGGTNTFSYKSDCA